jgi:HSP90 family molecular chaperone
MKTIYATDAAIEMAADEMKEVLNEVAKADRTEEKWDAMRKELGRQFIGAAFSVVYTPLNLNKWLYGDNL